MEDKDLQQLLTELHDEIENTKAVDAKESEDLRHLEADIKALLERSKEAHLEPAPDVIESLQSSINNFQFNHPTLTAQIYRVLELLSGSGI